MSLNLRARRIYELERQLPNRNFAKDHNFDEWLAQQSGKDQYHMPRQKLISNEALERMKQDLKTAGIVGTGTTVTVDAEDLSALITENMEYRKGDLSI